MAINSGQFNTEHHDEHGIEKPRPHASGKRDAEHPGYEVTDVNANGVVVFLAALVGFLIIFFVFCYAAGKGINYRLLQQDGEEASSNPQAATAGGSPVGLHRGASLSTNETMAQHESSLIAQSFPTPRLDADDSNQSTADLHAREDLLLEHYTQVEPGQGTPGAVRIPIEVAMQLLVKRGLPASNGTATPAMEQSKMTGDAKMMAMTPLTNGFARTSYELDQIELRGQKLEAEHASAPEHAKLETR